MDRRSCSRCIATSFLVVPYFYRFRVNPATLQSSRCHGLQHKTTNDTSTFIYRKHSPPMRERRDGCKGVSLTRPERRAVWLDADSHYSHSFQDLAAPTPCFYPIATWEGKYSPAALHRTIFSKRFTFAHLFLFFFIFRSGLSARGIAAADEHIWRGLHTELVATPWLRVWRTLPARESFRQQLEKMKTLGKSCEMRETTSNSFSTLGYPPPPPPPPLPFAGLCHTSLEQFVLTVQQAAGVEKQRKSVPGSDAAAVHWISNIFLYRYIFYITYLYFEQGRGDASIVFPQNWKRKYSLYTYSLPNCT